MAGENLSEKKIRSLEIGMWWQTSAAGGLDRVFESLIKHLPTENVDVLGIVQGPDGVEKTTDGQVLAVGDGNKIARFRNLFRLFSTSVETFKPDIISSHFAFYLAFVSNRIGDRPVVSHFHGPWSSEAEQQGSHPTVVKTKAFVEGCVYKRSDKIITLSRAFQTMLINDFKIPFEKIAIVPGSVDIKRFTVAESKDEARRMLKFPLDRPILVSVRRLVKRMGLHNLICAMRNVAEIIPDVMLYIAGKGPEADALAKQIIELDLQKNIELIGFISEDTLPYLYRAADINILATTALEGFGLTAIEALAVGTPSIVTPVGGLPEVVEGLSPDLLFESANPQAMADHLIAVLLGNIKLPDETSCQAHVFNNFSEQKAAKLTADIYRSLL